ncbi:Protein Tube [Apis cerana cerana]|uniref:Protein Tube n=1 Tax=Apis cerana cerana TaxID=94128 RepID=A0A2A3E342_APICC|nr:Protein Tube [Apis cerana cerana]
MSQNTIYLDIELRKLRPAELYILSQILNISDSWKKLMAIIPKDDMPNLPKFNSEHFSMIEQAANHQRSAAEIFLSEWGTMGKKRPTLSVLLNFLVKAELFRAADYVAKDLLKVKVPERPKYGPATPVDISEEMKLLEEKEELENFNFNESLIFKLSSEGVDNKTINSNAMNDSSLERNIQLTKLISSKEEHSNEQLGNKKTLNTQMFDLMKFSLEQNKKECSKQEQIFKQKEMLSHELPVFLNEFKQTVEQTKLYQEVLSEELPIFVKNSTIPINQNLSNYHINDSLNLSNLNINKNEIITTELPQCVVEFRVNNEFN